MSEYWLLLRFLYELDKWGKLELEKLLQSKPPNKKHQNKAREQAFKDCNWIYIFQF